MKDSIEYQKELYNIYGWIERKIIIKFANPSQINENVLWNCHYTHTKDEVIDNLETWIKYPTEGFMVWKIGTRQNQECRNKINALRLKKL